MALLEILEWLSRLLGLLAIPVGLIILSMHFESDSALIENGRTALCMALMYGGGWLLIRKSKLPPDPPSA